MSDLLDHQALTVTGEPLVNYLTDVRVWDSEVIRLRHNPLADAAGLVVLRGNLAPNGAIIKAAAAAPELLVHRGPALVFDSVEDMHSRIDDPELNDRQVLVLRLRSQGLPWHARGRQYAATDQASRNR